MVIGPNYQKASSLLFSHSGFKSFYFWVTCASISQLVKRPTLDFGSGHDVMVCGMEPHIRPLTESVELLGDRKSVV